ncbi:MAG TPA: tetratricopeptide repeat protein [archaeon]|nr:tetratricopeptide repeat protein [archaeon]
MRVPRWTAIVLAIALAFAGRALIAGQAEQRVVDTKSMTAAELEKAGDTCRAEKDYVHAIQYFQEAVRKDKKSSMLHNKLGLAELQAGRMKQARVDFEKAAKLNPKFADALNNVGAVYYIQKKLDFAATYFQKAVALDEARATFHANLGAAWFGQKKFDRAVGEYTRALELDPDVMEHQNRVGVTAQIGNTEDQARFYYMLAKIHAKRGDADACLRCLRMAKEKGYRDLRNVYKEEEFSRLWDDARLEELIPRPVAK